MTIYKKILVPLLILALAIGSVACGQKESQPSQEGDNITFCLDYTPNTNHTGLYVAQEKGYYKENGLNVKIVPPPEGGATALVAANKADFGIDFQDLLAPGFAQANPIPVTAVAALIAHNTSSLMCLADKGIDSPKDLTDKTYGTWNNPVEIAMVRDVVTRAGGDGKAVKTVPNSATDALSALQSGIDAVWVYDAWDGIAAKEKKVATKSFRFADVNKAFDYYTPVVIANNEFLKKSPNQAKAFLKATAQGYQYAIEHPEEAAEILLKNAQGLDADMVKASQLYLKDQYIADSPRWGEINPARWNAFYKWLDENKLIERSIPENAGFSNEYLS